MLVGDFDSAQALQLVSQYVGRVPKADRPVPRDIPQEPPQTKRSASRCSSCGRCRGGAYHVTNDGNLDSYPLHRGEGARTGRPRIYRAGYEKQMASRRSSANLIEHPTLLRVAIVQPGQLPEEATTS